MLVHLLACLDPDQGRVTARRVEWICLESFPGILPFHGLGQMTPEELASVYPLRRRAHGALFQLAHRADQAFALKDRTALTRLANEGPCPLPPLPGAAARWLAEYPETGLGRLQTLILDGVARGCRTPLELQDHVARADTPPRFWGDTHLWVLINGLAQGDAPRLRIQGPEPRLPQWESCLDLSQFSISMC